MPLPLDVARCHDDRCPFALTCRRYMERDLGVNHVLSFRNGDLASARDCKGYKPLAPIPSR
jgi:hypothetical protein